jgi:hypothetical protein
MHCNIDTMQASLSAPYSCQATRFRLEKHHHRNCISWLTRRPLQWPRMESAHMKLQPTMDPKTSVFPIVWECSQSSSNGGRDRGLGRSVPVWAQANNFLSAPTGPGTAT